MLIGPNNNTKKRKAPPNKKDVTTKYLKTSEVSFVPQTPSKQSHLINVTQDEWKQAIAFFKTIKGTWRKNAKIKMSRKISKMRHSFIRFDNEIVALANKSQEGILGNGSYGTVVVGQCQSGDNCAVKIEEGTKRESTDIRVQVMKKLHYLLAESSRTLPKRKKAKKDSQNSKRYTALVLRKGKNLAKISPLLNYQQKLIVAIKACEALLDIHSQQIIHADIKPENMVVDVNGNNIHLEMVDFDFSMIVPENQDCVISRWKGSEDYMAPEIAAQKEQAILTREPQTPYTFSSDIYALGRMFKINLKLAKHLYRDMLEQKPQDRCSLQKIMLRLVDTLAKSEELDVDSLQLIDYINNKYRAIASSTLEPVTTTTFVPNFTYFQRTINNFCYKIAEIPQSAINFVSYYLGRS